MDEDMVMTNIGAIPRAEFNDIMAIQYGFDSYEDLCAQGYRLGNEEGS